MSAQSINVHEQLECKDMASKNEPNDPQPKVDNLLEKDVDKNQTTECSNDYLDQMMKKLSDRDMALYEGVFLESDVTECSQICLDQVDEQSLLSVKDILNTDKLKKADNNEEHDKLEMIFEISSDDKGELHLEEISTANNVGIESDDEKDNNKQDLLSYKKPLVVDILDSSNITDEQSFQPLQGFPITGELEKADDTEELDKLEKIFEISNDNEGKLHLEEISTTNDAGIENDDEKDNDKQNLLSCKKPLIVDELDSSNIIDEQSFQPAECSLITDELEKAENDGELINLEKIFAFISDDEEISHLEEKPTEIDAAFETGNKCIDEKNDDEQDLLSSKKPLVVNTSDSFNNITDIEVINAVIENDDEKDNDKQDSLSWKKPLIVDALDSSNITDEQSFQPVQDFLITDKLEKAENDRELDKFELTDEISNEYEEISHLEEKPTEIDAAFETGNKCIDEKNDDEQDLLSNKKPLVVDTSNSFNNITDIEYKSKVESAYEFELVAADSNVKKIPIHVLKNTDLLKAFSHSALEDTDSQTEKSDVLINRIQNLNWLKSAKSAGSNTMEKRKTARKYSFDKEESYIDIEEELPEDAKTNSKSSRKRSGQPRNRKSKAADSSKQDGVEDKNKKKSSNVESASSSKNEFCHTQAVENSQDTGSIHPLGSEKMSIGRGSSDKRKVSLGNSKPRQSNDREQRNKTRRNSSDVKLSQMVEKNFSKNEANSSSQSSSDKVEKIENITEYKVSKDSRKPKDQKDWKIEVDSRVPKNVESSRNRSPVKNTARKAKDQEDWEKAADSHVRKDVESSRNQPPVKNTARKLKDQEDWETGADSQVYKNVESSRNQPPVKNTARKPKDQEDWETGADSQVYKNVQSSRNQPPLKTTTRKPKDQEDWEKEADSQVRKDVESSHKQPPVKNTARKPKDQEDWETGADSQVYKNVESSHKQPPVKTAAGKSKDQEDWDAEVDLQVRKNVESSHNQPPVKTAAGKSKDQEDWETEVDLQVQKNVEPLHSQSTVKNTGNYNQPSNQECKVEINIKKEQLPSREDYQESKNRSDTNLPSRPIYGRSVEKSKLEKIPPIVQGFGHNADKNRPFQSQNLSSNHNLNNYPEHININQNNGRYNDNRTSQSFREVNYSNKYSSCINTDDQDFPRWGQSNHSDKQNVKSSDWTSHTSNRHRVIVEEENKDTFGKNQGFTDRNQGSKRYSSKYQENRPSNGRYNLLTEQQRNSDICQGAYSNKYFDKNQNNRGFGERFYNDKNGDKYSKKFLDDNSSSDKHTDKNQQSKTSSERFCSKTHEIAKKNQELYDRNSTSFDKKKNFYDQPQTNVTISSDFSSGNQEFADKNESSNSTKEACSKIHPVNEDYSGQNQCAASASHYLLNVDDNSGPLCEAHEQERLSRMLKNCKTIVYQDVQHKSDIKSQKDSDNTQQANVQKELNEVEQFYSVPSAACQQDLSSSFDQNIGMYGKGALLTKIKDEPSQSEDWNLYKNTLKQDAAQSIELQNAYLQYNQAMLDSSNQLSNTLPSGPRPNILMTFEGNHNVQRALGIDSRSMSQSPVSQVGSDDQSRSDTYSPAPSQPQFSSCYRSAAGNPQTALAYTMSSTMNVNAPPFEVTNQPTQEFSNQQMYAAQSIESNHGQGGAVGLDNTCAMDPLLMNVISNYSEEYLALHQDIKELSKTLATKQAQLLAMQVKLLKSARLTDKVGINVMNQQTSPPIQSSGSNQVVQEQSQVLPSNYVHRSCPPGFSNVLLNVQSTQMNSYEMLTNTANYAPENLALKCASEPNILNRPKHLLSNVARANMMYQHQQQTANYQMYNDQTASSASTYVNIPAQRAPQRQIRDSVNQFAQQ